mmetsp:Transcript_38317/g.88454  ORF Transcript_38317/g.88454 Transcript_38317/m.88454 type:complete len:246 (-) Transcript_38317:15-752(-)
MQRPPLPPHYDHLNTDIDEFKHIDELINILFNKHLHQHRQPDIDEYFLEHIFIPYVTDNDESKRTDELINTSLNKQLQLYRKLLHEHCQSLSTSTPEHYLSTSTSTAPISSNCVHTDYNIYDINFQRHFNLLLVIDEFKRNGYMSDIDFHERRQHKVHIMDYNTYDINSQEHINIFHDIDEFKRIDELTNIFVNKHLQQHQLIDTYQVVYLNLIMDFDCFDTEFDEHLQHKFRIDLSHANQYQQR